MPNLTELSTIMSKLENELAQAELKKDPDWIRHTKHSLKNCYQQIRAESTRKFLDLTERRSGVIRQMGAS